MILFREELEMSIEVIRKDQVIRVRYGNMLSGKMDQNTFIKLLPILVKGQKKVVITVTTL